MYSRIWPLVFLPMSLMLDACQMPAALAPAPTQLTSITYEYTNAMATSEGHMLIDPDGRIRVVERVGVDQPIVHSADTYLTREQVARILSAFKGWRQLKPEYPAAFGPIFSISFDGYKVEAADSEAAAPALLGVKSVLDSIAGAALLTAPHPTLPPQTAAAPLVTYILDSDIDYHFEYDMSGQTLRRRITVSRDDGLLRLQEQTTGGDGPHDPALDVKIHLSASQLETLAETLRRMPDGDQRYPGIDNGPYYSIRYNARTIISGGLPDTPGNVKSAQLLIEGYAQDAKRFPEDN